MTSVTQPFAVSVALDCRLHLPFIRHSAQRIPPLSLSDSTRAPTAATACGLLTMLKQEGEEGTPRRAEICLPNGRLPSGGPQGSRLQEALLRAPVRAENAGVNAQTALRFSPPPPPPRPSNSQASSGLSQFLLQLLLTVS